MVCIVVHAMDISNNHLELCNKMDIIPLEVSYRDQIKIYTLQTTIYIAKALYTSKVMVI